MSAFLRILLLLSLLPVTAAPLAARAQFPGATPVGSDAQAQAITLTLPAGGTLDSVQILTGGIPNLDFKAPGNGTCTPGTTFPAGATCSLQVAFHPTAPGERMGAVVLLDRDRKTLANQFVTALATGPILTFIPGTINTVAGDAAWIYAGDGVAANEASIFLPFGIAVDAAGNFFIADSANNRIRRVDGVSRLVSTFAGTGVIGYTGDSGPALQATLSNPTGLALDPAGNLYFSDSGNNVIRRIDAFTGAITTVATHLTSPNGLAISAANLLYIADTGDHLIRQLNLATGALTTLAGRGTAGYSGDGGPASNATFSSPWSVTIAPSGALLVADQNNHRIRSIAPGTGLITTIAGTGQAGFSGDTGPANLAQLNVPASVAFDVAGNLYIADSGNNRIRKIAADTGFITTIAGNAGESISGDSGRADLAGLYGPYTLALDSTGSLLIADVFHNRVRRISAGGDTLDYPDQRVGRISTTMLQTVENDGNAPLDISALTPFSNSQLDPATTTCTSLPMASLAQCVAGIQFAPTVTGDPVIGLFSFLSDAVDSPSNLTLRGKVLNVDPAAITLTSGQNPSTTGQPVAFDITVTSAGATPTGAVTLLEGSVVLATAQLVPGGTATVTVLNFTGGNHTLTASYAGDPSNSSAVSSPFLQIVKDPQAATTTTLTSSANPITAGATLHLIAVITATNPAAATGQISGSVAYKEGLNTLGVANMVNGEADLPLTTLTPGFHTITATYTGNNTYTASTSAPLLQSVTLSASRLVLTTSANPSIAGLPITLTAIASSTGGIPGGTILFFDGPSPLGAGTLNPQGVATLVVPGANWLQSPHTLTASYAGDADDGPALSNSINELINVAHPKLALSTSLTPAPLGATITLSAAATSNGSIPTGSVQFLDGSQVIGKAALDSAGNASLNISTLALGVHPLTALYSGDAYNTSATSPGVSQTIQPTAVSITLATSLTPALFNDSVSFGIRVTGTGAQPGGKVALSEAAPC